MELTEKAYSEIVDLFARGSSASDIVAFHPSAETQDRVRYLLEQNQQNTLTKAEKNELDQLGQFEQMMQLVKAHARSFAGMSK